MSLDGFSLLCLFVLAIAVAAAMVGLSTLIGRRQMAPEGVLPYECGLDPVGSSRHRIPIKFFLIAVLFILFDVEVVFLYPSAIVFREFVVHGKGLMVLVEMLIFIGVLLIGLAYVWGRGALEWEEEHR